MTVAVVVLGQALPAGHTVHMAEPARAYEPGEHTSVALERVSAQANPAAHCVQVVAIPNEYVPRVHGTLPSPETVGQAQPAGQAVHSLAPPEAKYPAWQAVKLPLAVVVLGHAPPAGHGVHAVAAPAAKVPKEQTDTVVGSVVDGHAIPAGQATHMVLPASLAYPGWQGTGLDELLAHMKPAEHTVHTVAWPRLYDPAAHGAGDEAAEEQENPAGHAWQEVKGLTR